MEEDPTTSSSDGVTHDVQEDKTTTSGATLNVQEDQSTTSDNKVEVQETQWTTSDTKIEHQSSTSGFKIHVGEDQSATSDVKVQVHQDNHWLSSAGCEVQYSSSLSLRHGGYMYCEEVRLSSLSQQLADSEAEDGGGVQHAGSSSPVFVYSTSQILKNVAAYKEPLMQYNIPHVLGYSLKANYNPHLLHLLRESGCSGAITVSGEEIRLALSAGYTPESVVFNGTGKRPGELRLAVSLGCLINVDSDFDLRNIVDAVVAGKGNDEGVMKDGDGIMKGSGRQDEGRRRARVMIRINPNIDPEVHPFLATGSGVSKFGVEESQLPSLLDTIALYEEHITLVGLHIHLGSTINRVQLFSEALDVMLSLTRDVANRGFKDMRYVNLGGGLGIDYHKHAYRTNPDGSNEGAKAQTPPPPPSATDLILAVKDRLVASGLTLILEPGRSLLGNAGSLLTRVIGVKHNANKRYVVVDGSMNEIIRPALYGAYHHIELAEPVLQPDNQSNSQSANHSAKSQSANQSDNQPSTQSASKPRNQSSNNQCNQQDNQSGNQSGHQSSNQQDSQPINQSANKPIVEATKQEYDVVGPVCECADFLGKSRLLATPHPGCLLAVFDAGAYCSSMSGNYNLRLRPCEVLIDGSTWRVIRRADTLDDVIAPYNVC